MTELWDPVPRNFMSTGAYHDEVILRNTFVNAQMILTSEPTLGLNDDDSTDEANKNCKIRWMRQEHNWNHLMKN